MQTYFPMDFYYGIDHQNLTSQGSDRASAESTDGNEGKYCLVEKSDLTVCKIINNTIISRFRPVYGTFKQQYASK